MKLSIITINLNNRNGLQKTIDSVICQTSHDFEWIVIDGGSTDGSRELILDCQEQLTYWCSESDRGIYHAMNKGVAHATGDYCLFLNSGDYLYNKDVVKEVLPELDGRYDIVYGTVIVESVVGNKTHHQQLIYKYEVNSIQLINGTICHQSSFIKRHLLEVMPYDEHYKVASDRKFFKECYFEHNCSFHLIHSTISVMPYGGVSSTELTKIESDEINSKLFPIRLVEDLCLLDPELLFIWGQIPTSYRLKKFLIKSIRHTLKVYKFFKACTSYK